MSDPDRPKDRLTPHVGHAGGSGGDTRPRPARPAPAEEAASPAAPRPAPPPPARAVDPGAPQPAARRGRDRGGDERKKGRPRGKPGRGHRKPPSARSIARSQAPPPAVPPDVDDVRILVQDAEWVVRVLGRSGGARPGKPPLLLLGFWSSEHLEGDPAREALVVGETLSAQGQEALVQAFSTSREGGRSPVPKEAEPPRGGRRR